METRRTAVFPGSFDPFTNGHADLISRALSLFDRIVVAIGVNGGKQGCFPLEVRKECIQELFKDEPRVSVDAFSTLTIDYCRSLNAGVILRGLRSVTDWEYEKTIAMANRRLDSDIETLFLAADPVMECVSSSLVRDILRHGGDISAFVPDAVGKKISEYLQKA